MLYTTKKLLHEHHACAEGYKHLFSRRIADENEPIPLVEVLEINGLNDALWCMIATTEPCDECARWLAADFAEHVLPLFEAKYPDNRVPRHAIETARAFARGHATKEELRDADDAVLNAARDVAFAALAASDAADTATANAVHAAAFAVRAAAYAAYAAYAVRNAVHHTLTRDIGRIAFAPYAASFAARDAAADAAYAAAYDAAAAIHDAVADATAAADAEQQWQTARFRQMLVAHPSEL